MSCIRTPHLMYHTHAGLHRIKFQQPEGNKGSQKFWILLFNLYPKNIFGKQMEFYWSVTQRSIY